MTAFVAALLLCWEATASAITVAQPKLRHKTPTEGGKWSEYHRGAVQPGTCPQHGTRSLSFAGYHPRSSLQLTHPLARHLVLPCVRQAHEGRPLRDAPPPVIDGRQAPCRHRKENWAHDSCYEPVLTEFVLRHWEQGSTIVRQRHDNMDSTSTSFWVTCP